VYIVRCTDGSLYTGSTNAVGRRLREHNSGHGSKYTRSRRPVSLAFLECAADRRSALRLEARIKKLARSEKLDLCRRYEVRLGGAS
ncbi:MAG TPA: GIY-YIG nuclease family protein, partial [Nitrososphaerales archaeon]|nr:GIY-YIG nuclease family protein [Nitrososphaerales archaeon]